MHALLEYEEEYNVRAAGQFTTIISLIFLLRSVNDAE